MKLAIMFCLIKTAFCSIWIATKPLIDIPKVRKLPLSIDTYIHLGKYFGSSVHAAIRRYVEVSGKRCALLVLENIAPKGANLFVYKKFVFQNDRLSRTTLELIKLMVEFREKGVEFKSIVEGIDTSTSMGRIWYMLSSIFAENEREIIRERTKAELASARARGKIGGRPKGLSDNAKKIAMTAATLYNAKELSTAKICEILNIGSKTTLYRYLRHAGVDINGWVKTPLRKEQ